MAHHLAHHRDPSAYGRFVDRLNRFPQGAPSSPSLLAILKILFSEKEAGLVAQLPIKPFTVATAARVWKTDAVRAQTTLEQLASRALLLDMEQKGEQYYCLPPPMAGFFEFSMMRLRNDIDQKALAELFYHYLNVEEDFVRALFAGTDTPLGRIFVHERALPAPPEKELEVLPFERASHIIKTASHRGVSLCYCRHKMQHMDKACDAPMDICMTFNTSAYSLIKHGHARAVDVAECLDLLVQAQDHNLVQFGENTREGVNFICNCCGCCCEALLAVKRFAIAQTIHSNFLAHITDDCLRCGQCLKRCPVDAITGGVPASTTESVMPEATLGTKTSTDNAQGRARPQAYVDPERCIGCGVCARGCIAKAISMVSRPERTITPLNTTHRVVITAAEKGLLKELIEDNDALMSHKIMGAIISVVLKMPGLGRDFAVRQLKSRYMEALIARMD